MASEDEDGEVSFQAESLGLINLHQADHFYTEISISAKLPLPSVPELVGALVSIYTSSMSISNTMSSTPTHHPLGTSLVTRAHERSPLSRHKLGKGSEGVYDRDFGLLGGWKR